MTDNVTFKDSKVAFMQALQERRLFLSGPHNKPTVYEYMYMGTWDGKDQFKNINTREYLA